MERMVGTVVRGIRAPIIRSGDDLTKIVTDSVFLAAESEGFSLQDHDVVADGLAQIEGLHVPDLGHIGQLNTLPAPALLQRGTCCQTLQAIVVEGAVAMLQGVMGMAGQQDVTALGMDHAVVGLAVDDDANTDAGANGDVDAVLHVLGAAPGSFAKSGSVDVGVEAHGNSQSLLKLSDNGIVVPGQLGGRGDITISRRIAVQVHRAKAANAQGADALIAEERDHFRHGFRRCAGGDTYALNNVAVFVTDGADHLGAAGFQGAKKFHIVQLLI